VCPPPPLAGAPVGRPPRLDPPPPPLAAAPAFGHLPRRWPLPLPPVASRHPFWRRRLSTSRRLAAASAAGRRSRRRPPLPLPAWAPAPPLVLGGAPVVCRRPGQWPPAPPMAASSAACRRPRRWRRPRRPSVAATTPAPVRPAESRADCDERRVAGVGVGGRRLLGVAGASCISSWPCKPPVAVDAVACKVPLAVLPLLYWFVARLHLCMQHTGILPWVYSSLPACRTRRRLISPVTQ